jgi:putative RNA 2'-phosphotransferase
VLYHGTARRHLGAIYAQGIVRGRRHHVHLSAEPDTARAVGARHGQPAVLVVAAAAMAAAGHVFYRSDNGVWLTDEVPPRFLPSGELQTEAQ